MSSLSVPGVPHARSVSRGHTAHEHEEEKEFANNLKSVDSFHIMIHIVISYPMITHITFVVCLVRSVLQHHQYHSH